MRTPQTELGWALAILLWACFIERNIAVETDMKPYTKLDYRQSFKIPYFYGDNKSIPHFVYSGSSFLYCLLMTLPCFSNNCHRRHSFAGLHSADAERSELAWLDLEHAAQSVPELGGRDLVFRERPREVGRRGICVLVYEGSRSGWSRVW